MAAAAIFNLGKWLFRSFGWTYFSQIVQQMYNMLSGKRSCDQKRCLTKIQDGGGCHLEFHQYEGSAENDGHKNYGPSKLQDMKLQDMNLQDMKL